MDLCGVQPGDFDITDDLNAGSNSVTVYFHEDTWEVLDTGFVNVKYNTSILPEVQTGTQATERITLGELQGGQDHLSNMFNLYVPGDLLSLKFHFHLVNATEDLFILKFKTMKMSSEFNKNVTIDGDNVIIEFDDNNFTGIDYDGLTDTTVGCKFMDICADDSGKYAYLKDDSYLEFVYRPKSGLESGYITLEGSTRFDYDHGSVDRVSCGEDKYEWIEARYYIPDGAVPLEAKAAFACWGWEDRIYAWAENEAAEAHLVWDQAKIDHIGTAEIGYWIPTEFIVPGQWNHIRIYHDGSSKGLEPQSILSYKFAIKPTIPYGDVFPVEGGGYGVRIYYDGDNDGLQDDSMTVPIDGGGLSREINELDPEKNAVDDALLRLLDQLNFFDDHNEGGYGTDPDEYDGSINNPIDIVITPEIEFISSKRGGVQSLWGPANFKLITWM